MITVKQNISKASLSAYVEDVLRKEAEPKVKDFLQGIAIHLTSLSPVWSGAYVTSHSFVPKGSGAGRMRKSKYENGPQDFRAKRAEGLSQLMTDIDSFDFIKAGGGVFRNRAPHARGVEDGLPPARQPYNVYRTATARAIAKSRT